jgi:hypothetical protein
MLLLIVLFCMAFASTFYLLFAEQHRYENYPIAILSTFVSMLGDFSYDDLFVDVGLYEDFYSFKLAMFVIFVLLMVVVVNNVLIGLAVGDTEYVMNMAKVQRLRQHVSALMHHCGDKLNFVPVYAHIFRLLLYRSITVFKTLFLFSDEIYNGSGVIVV